MLQFLWLADRAALAMGTCTTAHKEHVSRLQPIQAQVILTANQQQQNCNWCLSSPHTELVQDAAGDQAFKPNQLPHVGMAVGLLLLLSTMAGAGTQLHNIAAHLQIWPAN
jgi:hypothetical protein